MKFNFSSDADDRERWEEVRARMAAAAEAALQEAGEEAVAEGRIDMASAGLQRFEDSLQFKFSAKGLGSSVVIFSSVSFLGVFEEGATIRGKPLLFLPIEANLPPGVKHPKDYGGKLVSVNVAGKPPLLFSEPSGSQPGKPLFVGVDEVTIRKRLHFHEIVERVVETIEDKYSVHLKVE